ncbi:MAG: (2Fe-2S)-binding protein [Phycisphaerales bacterium]
MVTRCICHDVTFAELRALADATGDGLDGLSRRTGCCTGCATCRPYVLLMLRTGQTIFPVLTPAQIQRLALDQPEPDPDARPIPSARP